MPKRSFVTELTVLAFGSRSGASGTAKPPSGPLAGETPAPPAAAPCFTPFHGLGLLLLLAIAACALPGRAAPSPTVAGGGVVTHPIDGDTVDIDLGGTEERVRLIGIDTPESVAHDRPVECFGPEAKARLAELLPPGTAVRLERDVEARDRFGRLLAYVYRSADDVHVNLVLVEEGFAEARPFEPNVTRQAELDRAEDDARAAGRGLWPACGSTDVPVGTSPG